MRLVDPKTGDEVEDDDFDTHKYEQLVVEGPDTWAIAFNTMQPGEHWEKDGPHVYLDAATAMLWACHAARIGAKSADNLLVTEGLLSATAITRCLRVTLLALRASEPQLLLKEQTKGVFLDTITTVVDNLDDPNKLALELAPADWLTIPEAPKATEFEKPQKWISSIELAMLMEPKTRSAAWVGWVMYAASGHGPKEANGRGGPLAQVMRRVQSMMRRDTKGDEDEDIAVGASTMIRNEMCPSCFGVYRARGGSRRVAAYEEIDTSRTREEIDSSLLKYAICRSTP
jgi:hypothetical protein